MSLIVYWLILLLVIALQALPLRVTVWIGRNAGVLSWALNRKHRNIVIGNLAAAFPEKSPKEILQIGRENTLRIGENFAAAIKTSSMSVDEVLKICDVQGLEKFPDFTAPTAPKNCIVAIGHFGNFELNAILGKLVQKMQPATTYRGLKDKRVNAVMQRLRERSGCWFFERRTQGGELKEALSKGGLLLGLLADQHISRGGVWVPFMGRDCSTTPAPALLALRYEAALFTAICYRTGSGRWRIEVGDEIATRVKDNSRTVEEITRDINAAFELAVRSDPANWFWVHKRWKPQVASKRSTAADAPATDLVAEPVIL